MYSDSDVDIECVDDLESNNLLTDAQKIFSKSVSIQHKTIKQEMGLSEEYADADQSKAVLPPPGFKIVDVHTLMSQVFDPSDPSNYTYNSSEIESNQVPGKTSTFTSKYGTRSKSKVAKLQQKSVLKTQYARKPTYFSNSQHLIGKQNVTRKRKKRSNGPFEKNNILVLPASLNRHRPKPSLAIPKEHAYSALPPGVTFAIVDIEEQSREETTQDDLPNAEERLAMHNIKERVRRSQLAKLIVSLQKLLPLRDKLKYSKIEVLKEGKRYCDLISQQGDSLLRVRRELFARREHLRDRLEKLKKRFSRRQLNMLGVSVS